jgi:hypothetical protein
LINLTNERKIREVEVSCLKLFCRSSTVPFLPARY